MPRFLFFSRGGHGRFSGFIPRRPVLPSPGPEARSAPLREGLRRCRVCGAAFSTPPGAKGPRALGPEARWELPSVLGSLLVRLSLDIISMFFCFQLRLVSFIKRFRVCRFSGSSLHVWLPCVLKHRVSVVFPRVSAGRFL